jgi:3-hydroxyisobutyrate dehydrogenase-like beta-hydroxyacid dehydrogenase
MTPDHPRIGFIGLGRMGAPIARNLADAGFPLTVFNRSAAKSEAFADETACTVATSVLALVEHSDIVLLMLADGSALESVLFADPAVVDALRGKLLVDMGTTGPVYATELDRRLVERGVRFAEAPVSGSTAAATERTLTLLVGAREADLETLRPLLEAIGREIIHLGDPGRASLVKLATNNLIYGINQCVAESLVLAERGGMDRKVVYDAFLNSAAAAPVMRYRCEAFLHPGEGEVSFTLDLAEKDLRLTVDLADALGSPMPQAELNRRITQDAIEGGLGREDVAIVAEHLRRSARPITPGTEG